MFIILGATGHVGSAVATALLAARQPVTIVSRDAVKAADWMARGAEAAIVDVTDVAALRDVFRRGRRAFLLNPPADPTADSDAEEHRTGNAIAAALEGSGLEKVVVASTYGAQPGGPCGDLNTLYDFEQAVLRQGISVVIQRGAYYYSNWDGMLEAVRGGHLPTMFPADLALPMVAPDDLGRSAAALLQSSGEDGDIVYVEGPQRYTPADVAAAFERALGQHVALDVTRRERWEEAYRKLGFSPSAASSYTRMTQVTADGDYDMPERPIRGEIRLEDYIAELVAR